MADREGQSFTATMKLQCIDRELRYRRRVYSDRVERGTMTGRQRDREIALMEAIRADYEALAARERLL